MIRRAPQENGTGYVEMHADPQEYIEPHVVEMGGEDCIVLHSDMISTSLFGQGDNRRIAILIKGVGGPTKIALMSTPGPEMARQIATSLLKMSEVVERQADARASAALAKARGK